MLRFLTDEQISPTIARQLSKHVPGVKVTALKDWRHGMFMGSDDRLILQEASKEGLTFVSYDQKTIRPLLKEWGEAAIQHGGVVFVDNRSIAPNDFGSLIKALAALWKSEKSSAWNSRVVFLKSVDE